MHALPTDTIETPTSFKALKEPLINDLLTLFKKSHEFKELQNDNEIEVSKILCIDLWLPFMENIVQAVRDSRKIQYAMLLVLILFQSLPFLINARTY